MSREIKSRLAMAKASFNRKQTLFTSILDLNLRMKLVQCYMWSTAFYGAETWTLQKVNQIYLESSEMWCWRKMEISWTNYVRNEEVLHRSRRTGISYIQYKEGRLIGLVTSCVGTVF
jgi:hypothetical protein